MGAGDQVRVIVFGEPELTGDFVVGTSGAIAYPLLGEVQVGGQPTEAIVQQLTERLSRGYVLQPRVSVAVLAYRPFYVLGEVNSPGSYPYAADMTLMAAVATAGGFTYRANKRRAYIRSLGDAREREVRLDQLVKLQPGDTLRIRERFF